MSKRDLKKNTEPTDKEQLEEQILELYEKFSPVKCIIILCLIQEETLCRNAS
jgi:hypothetical protein